METIIQTLQAFVQMDKGDSTCQEKMDKLLSLQDKIQTQFGVEFVDELCKAWGDIHIAELDHAYEQGFLTAFRLWMEVSAMGHDV